MREEESGHRRRLIDLYRQKFGEHIPLIRRQDVKGFVQRRPVWLARPLRLERHPQPGRGHGRWKSAASMRSAAARTTDASIRQLLDDLAEEERTHECRAEQLAEDRAEPDTQRQEEEARKRRCSCCRSCSPDWRD